MFSLSRFAAVLRFAGCALALVAIVSLGGCKRKYTVPPPAAAEPEDIKNLVSQLAVKKRQGFIPDIRVPSAERLGEIGPPAKEHGAIPALEKMAKDKDPAVKEAAEKALAKIKAGG